MIAPQSDAERYFVDSYGTDHDAVREGFRWLLRFANEREHSRATIFVYGVEQIRNLNDALGAQRGKRLLNARKLAESGVTVEVYTKRSHGYGNGPVLAVWVDDEDLLDNLDKWRVPAICAVPWDHITDWKARWSPIDIRTGSAAVGGPEPVTNPVALQALEALTRRANLSNGMDAYNTRTATQAFMLLQRAGEDLEPEQVRDWAARNGWGAGNARELAERARGVNEGRRLRVGPPMWRDNVVDHWREQAKRDA